LEHGVRLAAKILVVDDELIVCRSCQRVLAADGHHVSVATTGEAAIRKIREDSFDLTLLDLRIPGFGGLRVQRAIREISPQTDVIILTGYPSVENAKESIRLGAFDYVTKPFVPRILCTVVSQVLACKPWKIQERYEYGCR
jgi:DNA-binding NtrC family response regulator